MQFAIVIKLRKDAEKNVLGMYRHMNQWRKDRTHRQLPVFGAGTKVRVYAGRMLVEVKTPMPIGQFDSVETSLRAHFYPYSRT